MRLYVEGHGCSMAQAETGAIKGHALASGFHLSEAKDADFLVINTCAVKEKTEFKMLRRIRALSKIASENNSRLIVFGCLPKVNPSIIDEVAPGVIMVGPDLEGLSRALGIKEERFSPLVPQVRPNANVEIMPIASGCTNFCTFCGTKLARGNIRSHSPAQLRARLESSLRDTREFWLTGQDTGAYGLDNGSSLPELLSELLSVEGEFRVRIGMMNPHHLRRIYTELVPLFRDRRLYRFLHIPVQAGSDRVLSLMRRGYTSTQFIALVSRLREDVPGITIATDIIVGFPSETEKEFGETMALIREVEPDVVNISRFGARLGTKAAAMEGQLPGSVLKERSRKLTSLCREISMRQNARMMGKTEIAFFSEVGPKGNFVGRTSNYKPIVVGENLLGKFAEVEVLAAFPTYLHGTVAASRHAHGNKDTGAVSADGFPDGQGTAGSRSCPGPAPTLPLNMRSTRMAPLFVP